MTIYINLYDFLWWFFVGTRVNQIAFLFFSHLIYLPEHILKKEWVWYSNEKGKK